jgi:hypothetical protein
MLLFFLLLGVATKATHHNYSHDFEDIRSVEDDELPIRVAEYTRPAIDSPVVEFINPTSIPMGQETNVRQRFIC